MCVVCVTVAGTLVVATQITPVQVLSQESISQKILTTFSSSAKTLSSKQRSEIKALVNSNVSATTATCTGLIKSGANKSTVTTMRNRAKLACDYAKRLNPVLKTSVATKTTSIKNQANRVTISVRSPRSQVPPPAPTPAPSPQPVLPVADASPEMVDVCKVPDGRPVSQTQLPAGAKYLGQHGLSNVGFPRSPDLFPVKGEVDIVVAAVSFKDMPGSPFQIEQYLAEQTKKITEWGDYWSQGQIKYTFQTVPGWQELSISATEFVSSDQALHQRNVEIQRGLFTTIAEKIGNQVDWNRAQAVFVLFPVGYKSIFGEWQSRALDTVQTAAGDKDLFWLAGGEFHLGNIGYSLETKRSLLWSYWLHEILHSHGSHLHAPGNGWAVGLDRNQYPAGNGKFSGAQAAWEGFKQGWILDDQVFCVDARKTFGISRALLTPLEIYGGEKRVAIIRTGEHAGIVVESRRPIGYSSSWSPSDKGLLVYSLNTSLMNDRSGERSGKDGGNSRSYNKWSYFLAPDGRGDLDGASAFEPFIVKAGESVTWSGVKITLRESFSEHDYVSIELAQ